MDFSINGYDIQDILKDVETARRNIVPTIKHIITTAKFQLCNLCEEYARRQEIPKIMEDTKCFQELKYREVVCLAKITNNRHNIRNLLDNSLFQKVVLSRNKPKFSEGISINARGNTIQEKFWRYKENAKRLQTILGFNNSGDFGKRELAQSFQGKETENISDIMKSGALAVKDDNQSSNNKGRQLYHNTEIDLMDDGEFSMSSHQRPCASAPAILCHSTPRHIRNLRGKFNDIERYLLYFGVDNQSHKKPRHIRNLRGKFNDIERYLLYFGVDNQSVESYDYFTPLNTERDEMDFFTPVILDAGSISESAPFITPILCSGEFERNFDFFEDIEVPILDVDSVRFIKTASDDFLLVGKGTYGCVYLAQVYDHNGLVCVKEFYPECTSPEAAAQEAKILCYLQDEGIVPELLGIIHNELNPYEISLVQDYYGNGKTLQEILYDKNIRWSKMEVLQLLIDLTKGLRKVHFKNIIWNDLKANNILIDVHNKKRIAFIDFGVATFGRGKIFRVTGKSSRFTYLAPEVRDGFPTSFMSDIYSLGYLMRSVLEEYSITDSNLVTIVEDCLDDRLSSRPCLGSVLQVIENNDDIKPFVT